MLDEVRAELRELGRERLRGQMDHVGGAAGGAMSAEGESRPSVTRIARSKPFADQVHDAQGVLDFDADARMSGEKSRERHEARLASAGDVGAPCARCRWRRRCRARVRAARAAASYCSTKLGAGIVASTPAETLRVQRPVSARATASG
jgi:hypothetical protein